ncbi:MAG TPA: phospholipase D-like domain-containing protein [Thermodesulfobacteriota bacterium]|nr:phospholipase D-like domain-containing protein [Thermodesulfobacteriota bacterium]
MGRTSIDLKRALTADAFLRASGAPLVHGNSLRILRDGEENYPEWLKAIEAAQKTIHLEMYIIHNDQTGRRFRDLITEKARQRVKVRVLYDWVGSHGPLAYRMWKPAREAGAEVRAANPPSMDSLLGWASRDHRKLLTIDGSLAFISGLCMGDAWAGDPSRGIPPWRDTGVEIRGPAVADAEVSFAEAWKTVGGSIPVAQISRRENLPRAGNVSLRVVAASPDTASLYRLDLMVAASASKTLWLSDAYFIGTTAYLQALRSAALDGVDVRILVPHGSDIQWIANVSRTLYRSLLEAGVRVFEWNGPMMHAKTAVADGRWARVGSTNLNIASWIGNWELDVVVENENIGRQFSRMFLEDLANSTEIVITRRNKVRLTQPLPVAGQTRTSSGSGKHVLTGVFRVSSAINAAVTGHRVLSRTESTSLLSICVAVLVLASVALFLPKVIAYPVGVILAWMGILLLGKGLRIRFSKEARKKIREKKKAP